MAMQIEKERGRVTLRKRQRGVVGGKEVQAVNMFITEGTKNRTDISEEERIFIISIRQDYKYEGFNNSQMRFNREELELVRDSIDAVLRKRYEDESHDCENCLYYRPDLDMCDGYTYTCECIIGFCPMYERKER